MAITITDKGNYIEFADGAAVSQFVKPYDIDLPAGGNLVFKNDIERTTIAFSNIASPIYADENLLREFLLSLNNTSQLATDTADIENNVASKINRISGAANYGRALTYNGTGTENVETVTHTGTTNLGAETVIETITYVDPTINGSNITNIAYT